jgi:recombinational DNA repair ATPase RecF
MSRYFLKTLTVEGFRGINNENDPLQLNFKADVINSVFGENGRGKSSVFEALSYALTGRIPKLDGLPADERSGEYYCNRFHSTQTATITLSVELDSGGDAIELRVRRDKAGKRLVDSPSGYANPEGFLNALGEELTLLDYSTFRHFVEDSPLQRGRAFSSLLGLSKLSSLRQTFEVIANKGNLKSDFNLEADNLRFAQITSTRDAQERALVDAYKKLLGGAPEKPLDSKAISAVACAALEQVKLIAHFFSEKDLSKVDFESVRTAIRNADASDKRINLESALRSIAALEKLAPLEAEAIERSSMESQILARDQALKATKGQLFLNLYQNLEKIFLAGESDVMSCPACEAKHADAQDEAVKRRLEKYADVSRERAAISKTWTTGLTLQRLRSLESSPDMGIAAADQKYFCFNNLFTTGDALAGELANVSAHLDSLDAARLQKISEATALKSKLENELPPSLVALTEQTEAAATIQTSLTEIQKLEGELVSLTRAIALKRRWTKFVASVEESFSTAEVALSTAKTIAFESRYRQIYDKITANPSILPVLRKAKGSQDLHLRLEKFFTLSDVSATTLLPESYRNALAISIYLTAALQSGKASRFIVLDDVTSSFDAGHQFNLMQVLQKEAASTQNPQGLQFLVLSHDGLLEKFFDKMGEEVGWNHYRLDGLPPCGNVLTTRQDSQRIKKDAEKFINAGQSAQAKPLIRQYLEYSLLRIIRKLDIRAPLDFIIRDENKMAQACFDIIDKDIDMHQKANCLIMTPKQVNDWQNVCVPQIMGNFVSHYATSVGASISPLVYLSVLTTIDNAVSCFTYTCSCDGAPRNVFYRSLSQKQKGCSC